MLKNWNIDGKSGRVWFPEGEVVYQKRGVVIEPIYQADDGKMYIEVSPGKLQYVLQNPFNGYCYRQDGE